MALVISTRYYALPVGDFLRVTIATTASPLLGHRVADGRSRALAGAARSAISQAGQPGGKCERA